jgi:pyruvate/2-oxoglutarate/acetoin dehydrogenase E1 component
MNLAQTINKISTEHCRNGGLILGQNIEAQQSLCGTVPIDEPNAQIMPTCEVSAMGISIGAALSGRPVIHVIRFGSFTWLQASPLVAFASQCKSVWGYDLPLWVRISCDDFLGPTHSGSWHSILLHGGPALRVIAPMCSSEYETAWAEFQETKQPTIAFEHRRSYANGLEMPDESNEQYPQATILAVSAARFSAIDALPILREMGIWTQVRHIWDLSRLDPESILARCAGCILIVDSSYETCSFAEHLGYTLHQAGEGLDDCMRAHIRVLGMKPRHPGVSVETNGTPSAQEIADAVRDLYY